MGLSGANQLFAADEQQRRFAILLEARDMRAMQIHLGGPALGDDDDLGQATLANGKGDVTRDFVRFHI